MTTQLRKQYLDGAEKLKKEILKDYRKTRSARKTAKNLTAKGMKCSFQWAAKVVSDFVENGGKI
jgi:hypothetical protein